MGSRKMTEAVRGKRAYDALRMYMRNRPDIGLGRAVCDGILEAANPFDAKATRPPQRCFVLFGVVIGMGVGFFFYFNNLM